MMSPGNNDFQYFSELPGDTGVVALVVEPELLI
jgi:hypothetical protein